MYAYTNIKMLDTCSLIPFLLNHGQAPLVSVAEKDDELSATQHLVRCRVFPKHSKWLSVVKIPFGKLA